MAAKATAFKRNFIWVPRCVPLLSVAGRAAQEPATLKTVRRPSMISASSAIDRPKR